MEGGQFPVQLIETKVSGSIIPPISRLAAKSDTGVLLITFLLPIVVGLTFYDSGRSFIVDANCVIFNL